MTSEVKAKSNDKNIDIQINIENNLFSKNKCDGITNKKNDNKPVIKAKLGENVPEEVAEVAAGMAERRLYESINPQGYSAGTWRNRFAHYGGNPLPTPDNRWMRNNSTNDYDDNRSVDGYPPQFEIQEALPQLPMANFTEEDMEAGASEAQMIAVTPQKKSLAERLTPNRLKNLVRNFGSSRQPEQPISNIEESPAARTSVPAEPLVWRYRLFDWEENLSLIHI